MVKESRPSKNPKPSASEGDNSFFHQFEMAFSQHEGAEQKITCAIDFMKEALSRPGKKSLKYFWDAKKLCSPLFKEEMNPIKRNHLWSEYAAMTQEAIRLREFFNEQSSFAVEQIGLAIAALESEVAAFDLFAAKVDKGFFPKALEKSALDKKRYLQWQREFALLKGFVARLDGLRKEVLAQDIRAGQKNQFLKKLSLVGDAVFPRRKEAIKESSEQFVADVEAFAKTEFPEDLKAQGADGWKGKPYSLLRNMVKGLQSLAKTLQLTPAAFNQSRKKLSACWDWIKEKDDKKKEQLSQLSEEHRENFTLLKEEMRVFQEKCTGDKPLSKEIILSKGEMLAAKIKETELSRENKASLRRELDAVQSEALGKIKEAASALADAEKERVAVFKTTLEKTLEEGANLALEVILDKEQELREIFEGLSLLPIQQHAFERQFSDLRSFVLDKKSVASTSAEELETLYEERETQVETIREQVETYRLEMGGSGLDFEQAMTYRELYDSAKLHLDRELEAFDELREKLGD